MAGGKDQKDANQMLREQTAKSNQGTDAFAKRNEVDLNASRGRGDDLYGSLRGGYQTMADSGREPNTPGGGGGGGGGPMSGAGLGEAAAGYRKFAQEGGGISGESNKQIDDSEASYRRFMADGGLDATAMARMQGGGGFEEFQKTGGLSEGDRGNIRARATSTIPQFYRNMKDEASRGAAVQGGYGPGKAALMARFGRGQAAAGADASLNAELGIQEQVNAGRKWGTEGMASSENAMQGMRTGNMLAGTGGLTSIGQSHRDASMRAQEGNANFRMQGTQGLEGMASADRSFGASQGNNAQNQANWAAQFQQQQREAGLAGLGSMYAGEGSGEYNLNKNMDLQNRGQGVSQGIEGATALKTGNKTWVDYAAPIAGAVAGGMTGGLSSVAGAAVKSATKPKK